MVVVPWACQPDQPLKNKEPGLDFALPLPLRCSSLSLSHPRACRLRCVPIDGGLLRTCILHTGGMRARLRVCPSSGSVTSIPGGTASTPRASSCQSYDGTNAACTVKACVAECAAGVPSAAGWSAPRTRNVPGGSARMSSEDDVCAAKHEGAWCRTSLPPCALRQPRRNSPAASAETKPRANDATVPSSPEPQT